MGRLLVNLLLRYPAFSLAVLAFGVAVTLVGVRDVREFNNLKRHGLHADGRVISVSEPDHKAADMRYEFLAGGMALTNTTRVAADQNVGLVPGTAITVIYDSGNPAHNIASTSWPGDAYGILMVGVVMVLMPGFVLLGRMRRRG